MNQAPVPASAPAGRAARYRLVHEQLRALQEAETDWIANLANAAAALKTSFDFLWVGFYLARGEELVLGPFQGPPACTRIPPGQGVCGAAATRRETMVVADVRLFPGHIACSQEARSEIVVPLTRGAQLLGVLDVDSQALDAFQTDDRVGLEAVARLLAGLPDASAVRPIL